MPCYGGRGGRRRGESDGFQRSWRGKRLKDSGNNLARGVFFSFFFFLLSNPCAHEAHDTADVLKKNMYVSMINRRAVTLHWDRAARAAAPAGDNDGTAALNRARSDHKGGTREAVRYRTVVTATFSSPIDLWLHARVYCFARRVKTVFCRAVALLRVVTREKGKRTTRKHDEISSRYAIRANFMR